jgi:hypothetical protein
MMRGTLLALVTCATVATAQDDSTAKPVKPQWTRPVGDTTNFLYRGLGYGSDAYVSPFTVVLNKGYDIFQLRNHPRDIWTFPYRNSWKHAIVESFTRPGPAIEVFGLKRWIRIELLPLGWSVEEGNWFANYAEHLLGGGLTMRMLHEWNRAHGVPFPRATAMATTYVASILNEMTETRNLGTTTAGGVADIAVFDVAAIALFHWDQPTRFFTRTLQAADWSNQASFTFPNKQLQNNGQYFALKIPIGFDRTRLFVRGGMGGQFGISQKLGDANHFSVGLGGDTEVRDIDASGHETVRFGPSAGLYYDRDNSLLWSLISSPAENLLALNVFPGVIGGPLRNAGVWGVYTRRNEFRFGLVHRGALGLGIGYGR